MSHTKSVTRAACVLLPALLVGVAAITAHGAGNSCTGSGLSGALVCSGTCSPGSCQPRARQVGDETAVFCGCQEGQLGWACCYLLKWTSGPNKGQFFVLGDCISCLLPGTCQRGGTGAPASPYVAACE